MQVIREDIKKVPHIITDYMYNDDNIGINLQLLNETKTRKTLDVSAIPIEYSPVSINNTNNKMIITTELKYDLVDKAITMFAEINYGSEKVVSTHIISDETFANDIINTCIVNKKDIKNMPCYKQLFEEIKDTANANALSENMLIKTPELNYKCYIYSNEMELLGVANRILSTNFSTKYILGEYVGKKLTDYIDKNIFIDMCVNDEVTLQLANVKLTNTLESSLSYVTLDTSQTMIKRLTENYTDIDMKNPKDFIYPEYKAHYTIENYYEELLVKNSPKNIEKYFKDNKPNTNVLININKYLIW